MVVAGNISEELSPKKDNSGTHTADARADAASLAAYIADMSAELASLAARAPLPMLAHFLNLARVEAEIRSRELGGLDRPRRTARSRSPKRPKAESPRQLE